MALLFIPASMCPGHQWLTGGGALLRDAAHRAEMALGVLPSPFLADLARLRTTNDAVQRSSVVPLCSLDAAAILPFVEMLRSPMVCGLPFRPLIGGDGGCE
ncbi:hypothetical protein CAOG_01456 [Capsaspora owczarzaki ATCC 30864]|uniref:Uncharacterized protein n=1 Tax=Capsaspora owczarzaki (strain ATCC 30864) TaxID=595528 RepID=A0A0D2WJD2_CAPO3|nr:hypothetical protein CAOG_01456 [Capsaspora owczarzaki ATCC 30864]KJE90105.1 hypothetical protein CAOG_001456 [Capsaspora owczarzaki ATCC 30864]|eukprot:XP_004364324.1 hypothetical protein CAOG_01456 [Capsaspora owczarzaki ATCC 30864]